jgi:hypothetical protein
MKASVPLTIAIGLLVSTARWASAQYQYPFQNPDLSIERRVENIVSLMTLDGIVAKTHFETSAMFYVFRQMPYLRVY